MNEESDEKLEELLKKTPKKEFKPGVMYNEWGNQIEALWENKPIYREWINPNLTLYKDRATGKIIGAAIPYNTSLMSNNNLQEFWQDTQYNEKKIDQHLTLYISKDSDKVVGIKITNISDLLKK